MTRNGTRTSIIACRDRGAGFTIVELLVVISIIAVLMGLLLPSLSSVRTRSLKLTEANQIRQVGMAWQMYANQNKDAALPGYLDASTTPNMHEEWRVRYEYPMPPSQGGSADPTIPHEIAAPWTWRLAQYLDYDPEIFWGYRNDAVNDLFSLVENAEEVAETPAFGYNGYYVGGRWEVTTEEGSERARFSFWDAAVDNNPVNLVVRSVSNVDKPDNLITFCSSTKYADAGSYQDMPATIEGAHFVVPPTLGNENRWTVPLEGGMMHLLQIYQPDTFAPVGRFNNQVTLLFADGSTGAETMRAIDDQRRWINGVTNRDFSHSGTFSTLSE